MFWIAWHSLAPGTVHLSEDVGFRPADEPPLWLHANGLVAGEIRPLCGYLREELVAASLVTPRERKRVTCDECLRLIRAEARRLRAAIEGEL